MNIGGSVGLLKKEKISVEMKLGLDDNHKYKYNKDGSYIHVHQYQMLVYLFHKHDYHQMLQTASTPQDEGLSEWIDTPGGSKLL